MPQATLLKRFEARRAQKRWSAGKLVNLAIGLCMFYALDSPAGQLPIVFFLQSYLWFTVCECGVVQERSGSVLRELGRPDRR